MKTGLPVAVAVLVALTSGAAAQQATPAEQTPSSQPPGRAASEITLVYEREVYTYSGQGRRDPFRPLTEDEMGPRFQDLTLQGVMFTNGAGRSLALLADKDGRVFRVRVGDVVGNCRVLDIGPHRVVMAVENFGNIRQEVLELKKREGADR